MYVSIIKFKLNHKGYATKLIVNYRLWHERLGHISRGEFLEIVRSNMFRDVELLKNVEINNELCETCIKGKQTRIPFENF